MRKNTKYIVLAMVISLVLTPLFVVAKNITAAKPAKIQQQVNKPKDLIEIAMADDRFETLVAAIKAAGLVETLKGPGPFTVFAPTDQAFAKLPSGTVNKLLKPENKNTLVQVLTYHVLPGTLFLTDVAQLKNNEVTMSNGKKAKITLKNGVMYVNNVKVIATDIVSKNGIIHVLDGVLIPK